MRPALTCAVLALLPSLAAADPLADLGKALFFDPSLSATGTQSCASCHDPANGFASDSAFPEGAHRGHFGNRKPPSIAYQALSPVFHHRMDEGDVLFVGGNMHDGRATGALTGDPAADQAVLPLVMG